MKSRSQRRAKSHLGERTGGSVTPEPMELWKEVVPGLFKSYSDQMTYYRVKAVVVFATALMAAAANAEGIAPQALNSLTSPPRNLGTAQVVDEDNRPVGRVSKIDLSGAGGITGIEVLITGGGTRHFSAAEASYDPQDNVVIVGPTSP